MNAGRLSNVLVFQRRTLTGPQNAETWPFDFQEWGDFQHQSETFTRFIIRYRQNSDGTEISAKSHRIIFEGKIFHITNAIRVKERTGYYLQIDCDFSMMLEVSHLQSTEREFIAGLPVVRPEEP